MITIASALTPDGCDVIASLPITAAETWSRLPTAERLVPEWLSPGAVTCHPKEIGRSLLSGFRSPFERTDAMSSHPYRLSGPLNATQGKHSPDTQYSILDTLA